MFVLETKDQLMLAVGVFIDAASVFGQTIAFQRSAAGFVSLISFINVIYAMAADAFVFEEGVSNLELTAAFIIFIVSIIVTVDKIRRESASNPANEASSVRLVEPGDLELRSVSPLSFGELRLSEKV